MTTRVLVLSDTHVRSGGHRRLPDGVYRALDAADVVLHAGDIVTAELLHELSGWAPVHAVLGNNDVEPALSGLPESRLELLDGVRVAMVHDSGPRTGRPGRLRRRFPDAAVVVSATATSPATRPASTASCCSTPDRPRSAGRSPSPPSGSWS